MYIEVNLQSIEINQDKLRYILVNICYLTNKKIMTKTKTMKKTKTTTKTFREDPERATQETCDL